LIKIESGSDIPGGYRMIEKLGSIGFYINTWRAQDSNGQEVIVRFHWTAVHHDDFSPGPDMRDKISQFVVQFERIINAPATVGLAPWLRYSCNPDDGYIFLVRQYYPTKLHERFGSISEITDITQRDELLTALKQLAEGLDNLYAKEKSITVDVHEDNLFVDGLQTVITDYGCPALRDLIETSYDGPRPLTVRNFTNGQFVFLELTGGNVIEKAQAALAAIYYRLRLGQSVFGDFTEEAKTTNVIQCLMKARERVQAYLHTQQLELGNLLLPAEHSAIIRALAIKPTERFRSCAEFVQSLAS
jgi:hypothetical protein